MFANKKMLTMRQNIKNGFEESVKFLIAIISEVMVRVIDQMEYQITQHTYSFKTWRKL